MAVAGLGCLAIEPSRFELDANTDLRQCLGRGKFRKSSSILGHLDAYHVNE